MVLFPFSFFLLLRKKELFFSFYFASKGFTLLETGNITYEKNKQRIINLLSSTHWSFALSALSIVWTHYGAWKIKAFVLGNAQIFYNNKDYDMLRIHILNSLFLGPVFADVYLQINECQASQLTIDRPAQS